MRLEFEPTIKDKILKELELAKADNKKISKVVLNAYEYEEYQIAAAKDLYILDPSQYQLFSAYIWFDYMKIPIEVEGYIL